MGKGYRRPALALMSANTPSRAFWPSGPYHWRVSQFEQDRMLMIRPPTSSWIST